MAKPQAKADKAATCETWSGEQIHFLLEDYQAMFTTQKECAEVIGVSAGWWSACLHRKHRPGRKILDYMGVEREWEYTRVRATASRPALKLVKPNRKETKKR